MKTNLKVALAFVAALTAWLPAQTKAQVPEAPNVRTTWLELGKITGGVSVSTSSNPTALPQGGSTAWVCNTGTTDAYLAFGGSNVVAQSGGGNSNSWLKAGNCQNYNLERVTGGPSTFMDAVTALGTTTLQVETGIGANTSSASSSGGGTGGNVNVTQWNSVGLASPTAWGTAPSGGSVVPNMNVNCLAGCASGTNTTANGTITTTQSVSLVPGAGQSTVGIGISGTWTGTLFVEIAFDAAGTIFQQTTVVPLLGGIQTATITANGGYQANVAGATAFRIRGNTVASGTATVNLTSSGGTGTVMADNPFYVTGYVGMTPLNMQGSVAVGSATSAFPVMMGGTSTGASGGNAQVIKVDTAGNQFALPGTPNSWSLGSFGTTMPTIGTALGVQSGANMIAWPAKAANTVAATDVVPEVAVANSIPLGAAAPASSNPVSPSNLPVGSATINTNQVTVQTTAGGTLIAAARTGLAGTGRVSIEICNLGTTDVWLGNTGLTVGNGHLLVGIKGACTVLKTTAAVYGIAGAAEAVSFVENY